MVEYLDLHAVKLYGWHLSRKKEQIEEYRKLIREGFQAPPVSVCRIESDVYTLDMYTTKKNRGIYDALLDGGHRRAIAYFEEDVPLPIIISDAAFAVPLERRVLISDIDLI